MKIRFASILLALTLPLAAQDPVAAEVETMFYKAFYLEKGQNDPAGAMDLYQKFLDKAPEHKLAAVAAKQQFALLDRTGKSKERDAFKTRYEKLLGAVAAAPVGDAPARPAAGGDGQRPDRGARLAELEKQLAKAKEAGNAEETKRLEAELERMKQAGGGRGQGGGGRGGLMGVLASGKKVSEMTPEEMTQLKEGVGQSDRMIERLRTGGMDEIADKLEVNVASLKKALDAGNNDEAQKALEAIRAAMPARGGRGGRGGGGDGGGGGSRGGGGGGAGGGGGGGDSGGGGGGGGGSGAGGGN